MFGSVARGEDRPDSDVDFLADCPRPEPVRAGPGRADLEAILGSRLDLTPAGDLKPGALAATAGKFAAHGIAGARIDRIEAAAKANRALIYSYFGSKDGLLDAVMDAAVARVLAQVPSPRRT